MLQMLGTVSLHMNHKIIHWSSPHLCGSKWNWHSQYHLHFSDTNLMCLNMSQSNFVTGDRHRRRKKMNNPPTLIMVLLSQPHTHFSGIYHLCRQQPTLLYHMYCHSYLQLESHHAEVSSSNWTTKPREWFGWHWSSSWPTHRNSHQIHLYSWLLGKERTLTVIEVLA